VKITKFVVVKSLVLLQLAGACAMSFMHIVELGHRVDLGWQAWIAPFLIDGFALLGALGRAPQFDEATRKMGLRFMVGAGAVSLACNVGVGANWGQRVWGVIVVVGAIAAESYASKLTKAPEVVAAAADDAAKAKFRERGLKAAETRRRNKVAAEKVVKAAERENRKAAREILATA
jgi:hypothetical protein